jgi:hypothetical protein
MAVGVIALPTLGMARRLEIFEFILLSSLIEIVWFSDR